MDYVVDPGDVSAIPVSGSHQLFPVHRIYCVGKNYADHIKEMGMDPKSVPPCFFMKPADAATTQSKIPYPPGTNNYHYELELVLAIGKEGRNISKEQAKEYIFGYAVGFDMTRRDLQIRAGQSGSPWDTGKGFDFSAPISAIFPAASVGHITNGHLVLSVNGELRQDSDISQMVWKIDEIIAELSRLYLLKPGDLIFTGTPAGVGPVVPGDKLVGTIAGLGELIVEITPAE